MSLKQHSYKLPLKNFQPRTVVELMDVLIDSSLSPPEKLLLLLSSSATEKLECQLNHPDHHLHGAHDTHPNEQAQGAA